MLAAMAAAPALLLTALALIPVMRSPAASVTSRAGALALLELSLLVLGAALALASVSGARLVVLGLRAVVAAWMTCRVALVWSVGSGWNRLGPILGLGLAWLALTFLIAWRHDRGGPWARGTTGTVGFACEVIVASALVLVGLVVAFSPLIF